MRSPKAVTLFTDKPDRLTETTVKLRERYGLTVQFSSAIRARRSYTGVLLFHCTSQNPDLFTILRQLIKKAQGGPVLILADELTPEEIVSCYAMGVRACLPLPIEAQVLLRIIEDVKFSWWEKFRSWFQKQRVNLGDPALPEPLLPGSTKVSAGSLRVRLLGKFQMVASAGQIIDFKGKRTQSLLACLIYHGQSGISRQRLMNYFWPDVAYESARNSLNVAICHLRQCLRPHTTAKEVIHCADGRYYLDEGLHIQTDLELFTSYHKQALVYGQLGQIAAENEANLLALSHYQGDFLSNLRYQDWTTPIRDNLWETQLYILEKINSYYINQKDYREAIANSQKILEQDRCLEKVHRQLMLCYYRLGKRETALKQYLKCCTILREELQAEPSVETQQVYQMMLRQNMGKLNLGLF